MNDSFEMLLSRIPYHLHVSIEAYYHSLFLAWLFAYGFEIRGEEAISDGRIDAVLEEKDIIVIAEFKHSHDKKISKVKTIPAITLDVLLDSAIKQIHGNKYYKKYYFNQDNKKIILLGVAVSNKKIATKLEIIE